MVQLINPEVLEYADAHTTPPPGHLASVDASTREDFAAWGMMVGRQEGRFLELLVFATQATSVLEIGTFTGYSSIAMAAGLGKDGSIISLEVDPHHAQVARGNIAAAGLESHISVIEGPALRSLEELQGPFDLVFIDADKKSNTLYFDYAVRLGRPGTVIVVDNVVRGGRVAGSDSGNEAVAGVHQLVNELAAREAVDATAIQTVGAKGYDGFILALVGDGPEPAC
jgi:predicted O-methyltransferase YrrM